MLARLQNLLFQARFRGLSEDVEAWAWALCKGFLHVELLPSLFLIIAIR